jgi:hypothetical protein
MDIVNEMEIAAEKGRAAKELLDNPAVKEIFASLEVAYTEQWRSSKPEDEPARDDAYRMLRALDRLRGDLQSAASSAAVTAHNHRSALRKLR